MYGLSISQTSQGQKLPQPIMQQFGTYGSNFDAMPTQSLLHQKGVSSTASTRSNGFGNHSSSGGENSHDDDGFSFRSRSARSPGSAEPGPGWPPQRKSASNRITNVVGDVEELEKHCAWLENHNAVLTERLVRSQRGFMERMMTGSRKAQLIRVWDGWTGLMSQLRLEKQVYLLTSSLEQVQRMGKDCSAALEKEQCLKMSAETALTKADEEVKRLVAENELLRQQIQADSYRVILLEKRLAEAETSLFRSSKDAQGVLEAVTTYHDRRKELELEAEGPPPALDVVRISKQAQEDASNMMTRMSSMLERREVDPYKAQTVQDISQREYSVKERPRSRSSSVSARNGRAPAVISFSQPSAQYVGPQPQFVQTAPPVVGGLGNFPNSGMLHALETISYPQVRSPSLPPTLNRVGGHAFVHLPSAAPSPFQVTPEYSWSQSRLATSGPVPRPFLGSSHIVSRDSSPAPMPKSVPKEQPDAKKSNKGRSTSFAQAVRKVTAQALREYRQGMERDAD